MLTELDGKPVSEEALLGALDAIHKRVEKTFSKGMGEVSVTHSKPVSDAVLDSANVDIICQDPRLSMPGPGRRMLVIREEAIQKNGRHVNTISKEDFHFLLDLAASTYDIASARPGGAATKKVKQTTLASEGFRLGRLAISARM